MERQEQSHFLKCDGLQGIFDVRAVSLGHMLRLAALVLLNSHFFCVKKLCSLF